MSNIEKLKGVLDFFERQTEWETGVRRISGGFALAELVNHDDEYFDIQLKWGVESDCENTVHTEQYKLLQSKVDDRELKDICLDIEDA